jgi:hypothetical protein
MGPALATFNNKIYVIGGGTEGGFPMGVLTGVIEVYDPTGSVNVLVSESPSPSSSLTPSVSPTEPAQTQQPTPDSTQSQTPASQQDNTLLFGIIFASVILILLISTTFYMRGNRKGPKYFDDANYYGGPDQNYVDESFMRPDIQYPNYQPAHIAIPQPYHEELCPYCKLPTNGGLICPHCYRRIR